MILLNFQICNYKFFVQNANDVTILNNDRGFIELIYVDLSILFDYIKINFYLCAITIN